MISKHGRKGVGQDGHVYLCDSLDPEPTGNLVESAACSQDIPARREVN